MITEFKYPTKTGEELRTDIDKSVIIGKRIKGIMEHEEFGQTYFVFDDDTILELAYGIDNYLIWEYHTELVP